MGEYLDRVVKTDHCAQYVDNTGIAAKFAKDWTWNIRAVLQCIRIVWLKMAVGGCLFEVRQTDVPGRTNPAISKLSELVDIPPTTSFAVNFGIGEIIQKLLL